MWEDIIRLAVGNGLWAVLSCALLFYLLKDSKKREQKYTEIIGALGERLKLVVKIKEETEKILEAQKAARPAAQGAKETRKKSGAEPLGEAAGAAL